MARTAVVAGTATAVVGGVEKRQAGKAQAAANEQAAQQAAFEAQQGVAEMQQQMAAMQAEQAAPAAPTEGGDDLKSQLERLAGLHQSGVLTDEEFAAAKAKVLGI
jgi:hypothetical protein